MPGTITPLAQVKGNPATPAPTGVKATDAPDAPKTVVLEGNPATPAPTGVRRDPEPAQGRKPRKGRPFDFEITTGAYASWMQGERVYRDELPAYADIERLVKIGALKPLT